MCSAALTPSTELLSTWNGDLLVLPFWQVDKHQSITLAGEMAVLDARLGGAVAGLIADHEFCGAAGLSAVVSLPAGTSGVRRIAVVGLGKESDFKQSTARQYGATLASIIINQKSKVLRPFPHPCTATHLQLIVATRVSFTLFETTGSSWTTSRVVSLGLDGALVWRWAEPCGVRFAGVRGWHH